MREMLVWLLKSFIPFFLVGLLIFAITRHVLATLSIITPISLVLLPIVIAGFYAREIRKAYPFLRSISVKHCPLCGEKLLREKFTNTLFLLPYTFKTLRHYEKRHEDISKYARRARLALTAFVHVFILAFGAIFALRSLEKATPETSLFDAVMSFLVSYFLFLLIAWGVLAYLLLRKRGSMFEGLC